MGSPNIIKTMEEEITRLQKELDKAHSERKVSQNEFLVCGNTMKIDILGTEYRIETHKVSEDSYMEEKAQEIYRKKTLRHEIMHAFLNESGLSDSSNRFDGAWAKNEEMVDWLAIQTPKIYKTFQKLNII